MRRAIVTGGAVAAIAAAAAGGYFAAGTGKGGVSADTTPDAATGLSFTPITRGDLVRYEEFDATAGYGTASPVVLAGEGTLTGLPEIGQIVAPGDTVAEIDGRPVIAAAGAMPMWRDLRNGVDDGADVRQVEQLLADLGYAATYDVTVDDEWTNATTRAVKAFQEDHGQDDDGVVDRGELVFFDGAVRVSKVAGVPGQGVGDAGIEVTSTEPAVTVELDADDSDLVAVGDAVTVELADGRDVDGTVAGFGAAITDQDGATKVPVEVTIDAEVLGSLPDGSAVVVKVPIVSATDVLSVPVEALLAVVEGGYAVEVRGGAAGTRLVGVDTGAFADGRVEITGTTGDLAEGDEVVVP